MIRHFFMTALKPGTDPAMVDTILEEYQKLKNCVPGITDFHAGKNLGWYQDKITLILVADLPDRKTWDLFLNHPIHLEIAKKYMPLYDPNTLTVAQLEL